MPRKHKRHEEEHEQHLAHDEGNWLVSYADMMTLLFGFFVLMYALGRVDEEKFAVVRKDIVKYFGGKMVDNPGAVELKKKVEEALLNLSAEGGEMAGLATAFGNKGEESITMEAGDRKLKISFESEILFGSGSAELTAPSAKIIDKVATELKKFPMESIEVEGHTDAEPIHSAIFPSNWELSSARSSRIVRRFIQNQIKQDKLVAKGYGDSQPLVPHLDANGAMIPENKIKNRRVVLMVKLGDLQPAQVKGLEGQGFRRVNAPTGQAGASLNPAEAVNENGESQKDLKQRLEEAQTRYQETMQKLKSAQEMEKSVKEMEALAKKTQEVEKKIETAEKKAEEAMTRAQKVMQNEPNGATTERQAQPQPKE